ncbi:MAG: COX15/CtaA family protein [Gemmatimonadota bacterium]|nr:COX15/CtaA family protein [Gemmatimonadota bacterium]
MLHGRAFTVTVAWTLLLLYLGSVVHATESSLACPDWPTCFGTLVPEMEGGIFWEHLHRLVAGGLLLMFGLATWLARKETSDRPWIFRTCLAGMVLLVIQAVVGGLTVLYQLPDLVSTTHLSLALLFLVLATWLASSTSWSPRSLRAAPPRPADAGMGRRVGNLAGAAAVLVFLQSVIGGLVRHTDAGMACPDAPLCLGQVVPPLINTPIILHFAHRVVGMLALIAIVCLAVWVVQKVATRAVRTWALLAAGLVVAQVCLGFLSVLSVLAVVPVSFHTLGAASLLTALVHLATLSRLTTAAPPRSQKTQEA